MNETTTTCARRAISISRARVRGNTKEKTSQRGAWTSNARAGDATDARTRRARAM